MSFESLTISPANPLIITTEADLKNVIGKMFQEYGFNANTPIIDAPEEKNTRQAKKYLADRGHHVKSDPAFKQLLDTYSISATRRGKENWYKVSDLNKIPTRI